MKKIAILQRHVTDYRVKFYNDLNDQLLKNDIHLSVYAGETGSLEENKFLKSGIDSLSFGKKVKNLSIFKSFYWQNIFFDLQKYDLVICEQANSTLINYPLIFWRKFSNQGPKFAYWGHGLSLDKKSSRISTYIKKNLARKADYWFAYTQHTRLLLNDLDINDNKIAIVNNSIDLNETHSIVHKEKSNYEKNNTKNVIVCSRLVKSKKIPFIIKACEIAKKKINNLNLIIVGDGPEKEVISKICESKDWIKLKGSLFDINKSRSLVKGDIMCLPSHVGLSILDGFSARLPVLVANFKNHCPEIAYFQDRYNGLMSEANVNSYAENIVCILENNDLRRKLAFNAFETSKKYSHENMVNNFFNGIIDSLKN